MNPIDLLKLCVSHPIIKILLECRAGRVTILHSPFDLIDEEQLRVFAFQYCTQLLKYWLNCSEIRSDASKSSRNVLDAINRSVKELDTLESSGSDADRRSSDTEKISHLELDILG